MRRLPQRPFLPQFPHRRGRPDNPSLATAPQKVPAAGWGRGNAEHPPHRSTQHPAASRGGPNPSAADAAGPSRSPLTGAESDLNRESERLPGLIREYLQPLCSQLDSQVTAAAGDPDAGVKVAGGVVAEGQPSPRGQLPAAAWPGNPPAPQCGTPSGIGDPIMAAVGVLVPAVSMATVGLPVQPGAAPSPAQYRVPPQPSVTLHLQQSQRRVPPVQPSMQHSHPSQYGVPPAQQAAPQLTPVPHPSSAQHGHV